MSDVPLPVTPAKDDPDWGIVTFLDILGWKGIFSRNPAPLKTLQGVLGGISKAQEKTRGLVPAPSSIEVKSISDTIVIFTICNEQDPSSVIEAHGVLCAWAIPYSIENGIPVRGATAAGEFSNQGNAFVGKAIDEAASWHEDTDWIGVNLTPTADFLFTPRKDSLWTQYQAPFKKSPKWSPHCVNWARDSKMSLIMLCKHFSDLGPVVPEIAGKFLNTIEFYKKHAPSDA